MIKFTQVFVILIITNHIWCDECDGRPDFKEILKCCNVPLLIDMDLLNLCAKELDIISIYDIATECNLSECVFNKTGSIVNGKPGAAEIKKYVKKLLDENSGLENVFNAAVDKCVPLVIAQETETKKRVAEPRFYVRKTVNPMYAHLMTCIGIELLFECPEKSRGEGVKCTEIKGNLKKCSSDFPPSYLAEINQHPPTI